jgi:hypothetical protein
MDEDGPLDDLNKPRQRLLADRRAAAKSALKSAKSRDEEKPRSQIAAIQVEIEAVDRAIKDEMRIARR